MMMFPQLAPSSRSPVTPASVTTPYRGSGTLDRTQYLAPGISVGVAPTGNERRFLVAAVMSYDNTTIANSELLLDGDALTKLAQENVLSNSLYWYSSIHFGEFTDTDTNKDLELNYSQQVLGSATHIFNVITGPAGMSLFATSTQSNGSGAVAGSVLCPVGGVAVASVMTRNATGTLTGTQGEHNIGDLNWNGVSGSDLDSNDFAMSYGKRMNLGGRVVCHPDVAPIDAMSITMGSFRVH
jgi:hypothetical protein